MAMDSRPLDASPMLRLITIIAALAMSLSSASITANALRLRALKL
jgi:cation transport ATPase